MIPPDANPAEGGAGGDAGDFENPSVPPAAQPAKPKRIEINAQAIPRELREVAQWVVWSWTWNPKKNKGAGGWDKPPLQTNGHNANVNNPDTWTTFDEALRAAQSGKFDGIGFVLTVEDPFAGFDLDKCVIEGVVEPWAERIIKQMQTYTELSPSGKGIRILFTGELPSGRRRTGRFECYDSARYLTVTGAAVHEATPLPDRTEAAAAVHARVFAVAKPVVEAPLREQGPTERLNSLTGDDLIARARNARNGDKFSNLYDGNWQSHHSSQSEADLALCSNLAFWTGKDAAEIDRLFRLSGLMRPKWNERRGETTYGERTITAAVQGCTAMFEPVKHNGSMGGGEALSADAGKPDATTEAVVYMLADILAELQTAEPRISTGLKPWDATCDGGFKSKAVTIVMGPPGSGKTTLLAQSARSMARDGVAVAWLAIDEDAASLVTRNAQAMGIASSAMKKPDAETSKLVIELMGAWPLLFYAPQPVENVIGDLAQKYPNHRRVVIIDSIQTARSLDTNPDWSPRERLDNVLLTIKRMAAAPETRCAVVATCEMNRGAYRNKNAAMNVESLAAGKESGALEYQADAMFDVRNVAGSPDLVTVEAVKVRGPDTRRGAVFGLRLDRAKATFIPEDVAKGDVRDNARQAALLGEVLACIAQEPGINNGNVRRTVGAKNIDVTDALAEHERHKLIANVAKGGRAKQWECTPEGLERVRESQVREAAVDKTAAGRNHTGWSEHD